jgi:hypothetical protein
MSLSVAHGGDPHEGVPSSGHAEILLRVSEGALQGARGPGAEEGIVQEMGEQARHGQQVDAGRKAIGQCGRSPHGLAIAHPPVRLKGSALEGGTVWEAYDAPFETERP